MLGCRTPFSSVLSALTTAVASAAAPAIWGPSLDAVPLIGRSSAKWTTSSAKSSMPVDRIKGRMGCACVCLWQLCAEQVHTGEHTDRRACTCRCGYLSYNKSAWNPPLIAALQQGWSFCVVFWSAGRVRGFLFVCVCVCLWVCGWVGGGWVGGGGGAVFFFRRPPHS